ncbi:ComGF family competence protein [Alkalicoccus urumqiensis]|nr:ComGF family competence protein [Alkalicoccus urumqiensis]
MLLSTMIGAAVIFLLLLTVSSFLFYWHTQEMGEKRRHEQEVSIFFMQLEKEFQESAAFSISGGRRLLLNHQGRTIAYEPYGTRSYIRRVNSTGHEVVLQYMTSVQFQKEEEGMHVEVLFGNNVYEAYYPHPGSYRVQAAE